MLCLMRGGSEPRLDLCQEERLRELIASGESALEAYYEPRHVADVLQDFSSAKPALTEVSHKSVAPCVLGLQRRAHRHQSCNIKMQIAVHRMPTTPRSVWQCLLNTATLLILQVAGAGPGSISTVAGTSY